MAPPGVLSFYDNFDKHNSPSSLLLSPFPSFTNCISHTSVFTEHNYFFKNIGDNMKETSPENFNSGADCFDFDLPTGDKSEVITSCADSEVSQSPLSPSINKNVEVSDNVFNDVTLTSRQESHISCDTDFLQGLDELEFDFDDCEPSREISLENFIDATLEDTMDLSLSDNIPDSCHSQQSIDEEEDIYKKEFFLKHLRLQRVSSKPSTPLKNRKRKHEESESKVPESLYPSCLPLSEAMSEKTSLPLPPYNISNTDNTKSNSQVSHLHSNTFFTPLSVPSKLCSCASSDWKRTILYSTAKSSDVTSVQTSPSTASVSGIASYRKTAAISSRCHSDSSYFLDNDDCCLSPSLLLSDKAKECFEFDLLDKNEMDEDTKDLLQWLDSQDIQTTIAGITSSYNQISSSVNNSRSPSGNEASSTSNDMVIPDDLEAILSPENHHSSLELETFQDLEDYVLDEPSPVKKEQENTNVSYNGVFPKSHLRLSILADISADLLNSEYKEKKEAIKRDIIKSFVSCSSLNHKISIRSNSASEYWSDSPFSSSSLSSSPSSSPPHSPSESSQESSPCPQDFIPNTHPKNLELLNLFSDENAAWCL